MDNNPNQRPAGEQPAGTLANKKRPTQRSNEASMMWTAVIAGLVFIVLGAGVALWIFIHYSKQLS